MAAPAHNRGGRPEEDEDDPVDRMISRTGCGDQHYAVQECMAEHQDWRLCQQHVQKFKDCMSDFQQARKEELKKKRSQMKQTSAS